MAGGESGTGGDLASVHELDTLRFELFTDFLAAFEVAWNKDQEEIWKLWLETSEHVAEDRFFTIVGAASDEDGGVGGDPELLEHAGDIQHAAIFDLCSVELEAAKHLDGIGLAPEFDEPFGVVFGLSADTIETFEERSEEESEAFIAAERARGETRIDEEKGDAAFFESPDEIGPDFGFDEHDGFGVDGRDGAVDVAFAVDGIVNFLDVGGEFSFELLHSCGGGGRDDDFEIGNFWFEHLDQLGAEIDFTDTDGVDPNGVAIGERVFGSGREFAEPFAEALAPASAAPHLQEVVGRREPEADREQKVIEGLHPVPLAK